MERSVILTEGKEIKNPGLRMESSPAQKPGSLNLEEMEKHMVIKALERYQGNISKAAKELGLTRAALYRRMEKHDL